MFTLKNRLKLDRIYNENNSINIIIMEEDTMDNNSSNNKNNEVDTLVNTSNHIEKSDAVDAQKPVNWTREIIDWALHIIGAIAIALLIVKFVAQVTVVIGSSMEPTLHDHNRLMMEKISPRYGSLSRGDIVVVEAEKELVSHGNRADHSPLIKRIIGIEGDHIRVANGKVYVNDAEQTETYINGNFSYTEKDVDVTVEKDKIFVMGDNRPRDMSIDSRVLGTFDKSQVIGRVLFRLFPFTEIGRLNK